MRIASCSLFVLTFPKQCEYTGIDTRSGSQFSVEVAYATGKNAKQIAGSLANVSDNNVLVEK